MKPEAITPIILTFNEQENLERCLARLDWAERILVVDSFSTDSTPEICESHPAVTFVRNRFLSHAQQANFALEQVQTDWVLSLDADYIVPASFLEDLQRLGDIDDLAGAWASFQYCVFGRPLRGSLYPPRLVLYRRKLAEYHQDGHAHRVMVKGRTGKLLSPFDHDDRKPLDRWFASQARYTALEMKKLSRVPSPLSLPDRIRLLILPSPFLVFFWCLLFKGCLWDGWRGWYYTFQRVTVEFMLSVALLDQRLRHNPSKIDET